MILRTALSLGLLSTSVAAAQKVELRGTVGQQRVVMSIDFDHDSITSATYRYESQKNAVPISESRFLGTTVVLADEDGNVFHLHLLRADGSATTDVKEATRMDGTMDRGDLDLPVKMERMK